MQFDTAAVVSVLTALGAGAVLREFLVVFINRRRNQSAETVARLTTRAQIELTDMSVLQSKIASLSQVIDTIQEHNKWLHDRETAMQQRIQDLERSQNERNIIHRQQMTDLQRQLDIISKHLRMLGYSVEEILNPVVKEQPNRSRDDLS